MTADDDDTVIWERVTVDVDEYLLMDGAAFKLHFRMYPDTFEVRVRRHSGANLANPSLNLEFFVPVTCSRSTRSFT